MGAGCALEAVPRGTRPQPLASCLYKGEALPPGRGCQGTLGQAQGPGLVRRLCLEGQGGFGEGDNPQAFPLSLFSSPSQTPSIP